MPGRRPRAGPRRFEGGRRLGPYAIVSGDFRRTGGMDVANHALARYLAARGDEVHLTAHHVDDDLAALPTVQVHRVPKPGGSYLLAGPLLDHAGRRCARAVLARGGRSVVNGGNCRVGDVNWVHYVHAAYAPEVRARGLRRIKARLDRPAFLRDERLALRRARLVIANSRRTRDDLITHLGLDPAIVHAVYYGIDADRFAPITPDERSAARAFFGWDADRPVVAFIGALGDRRKGFDTLFTAWESLARRDSGWDARLAVAGAGAELDAWKARAAASGLADSMTFLGYTREVPRLLAASDALVHPARYEAYGLGVHEALCRGLPALVTSTAGVAERYPDSMRDLLLPDPDDAADLAARLSRWRSDLDDYRSRMTPLAADLRRRSWDDMAAEIAGLMGG